jgi:hypothetical protein
MNTRYGLGIATAFATLFLSVGQAFAVTPAVINACVDNNGGIRLLQTNQYGFPPNPCQSYETPISWQAVTQFVTHRRDIPVPAGTTGLKTETAYCDPGEQVTGGGAGQTDGGATVINGVPTIDLIQSAPALIVPSTVPFGWTAIFLTDTRGAPPTSISVWVICAKT